MGPLLTLLGALACNSPLQHCASDPECSAPEWCDTSVKVCVQYARPNAGIDSGQSTDAGGPSDAGGDFDAGERLDAGDGSDARGGFDAGDSVDAGPTSDSGWTHDAGGAGDAGSSPDSGHQDADAGEVPALLITTPDRDGDCSSSCVGALVSAKSTRVDFSGTVSGPAGLSGALKVSITRNGMMVLSDTTQPSGGTWSWTWDTSGLTDDGAAYTFAVEATNARGQTTTVARRLWVDRKGPVETAWVPSSGAADVWPLDPLRVTFSERLAPASISDSAVRVLSNGAIVVSKRLSLSTDGRTLAVKLLTPPTAGGQLKVSIDADGVTDLLGNPLTSPSTPWQWSLVPIWVELAARSGSASGSVSQGYGSIMGVDQGAVLATLIVGSGTSGMSVSVYEVNRSTWTSRGTPYLSTTGGVRATALALGSDSTPYLATMPYSGKPSIARGTPDGGTSWTALTSLVDAPTGLSSLIVAPDDNPVLAWISAGTAYVSHWSGHDWTSWGALTPSGSTVSALAMAPGEGRAALAGWVVEAGAGIATHLAVAAWNGNGWTSLGQASGPQSDPTSTIGAPVIGVNSKGQPVALWVESSGDARRVFMSTLEDGATWRHVELSPPCIGTFLLDAADGVIDVCTATTSRWDTTDWIPLGGTLPVGSSSSSVTVGATSSGWPVVAWMEQNGPAPTFKVRRFNR